MRRLLLIVMLAFPVTMFASHPDCAGSNRWPTMMAFWHLKNIEVLKGKMASYRIKSTRLASEKIGKDLYRQIHRVVFTNASGKSVIVITNNDASSKECSMSGLEVYIVSKKIERH